LKSALIKHLKTLSDLPAEKLLKNRYEKYRKIGSWQERKSPLPPNKEEKILDPTPKQGDVHEKMATLLKETKQMSLDFERLLGADAKSLLEHQCKTIPKESIHLPGPDYIDKVYRLSDRPTPVLKSLQALFSHGRLKGTGYLSILPVDQGN